MRDEGLFAAAGALRSAYADVDWSATPLGPVADWTPTLRGTVDLMLHTRFPVTLFWGPEFVLVYNEAYVDLIADKHPGALGRPAREVFPEAWAAIGPWMQDAYAGAGPTSVVDAAVPLFRHGRLEEAYFTFCYAPVRDRAGTIEGVMDIATETTAQVVDRRRLVLLNDLRELLLDVDEVDTVVARALELLRADVADLPAVDVVPPGRAAGDVVVPVGPELVLAVTLSPNQVYDARYQAFVELLASTLAHALDRIGAQEAERSMSATLQRGLLSQPPTSDRYEVAVRYRPAARQAQVGGDWYDAFHLTDGSLAVVVGDVAGHDRLAAAEMAQARSLLRGVAIAAGGTPGAILAGLDHTMQTLGARIVATAVLARLGADGVLRWSNAGHPPPVLVGPDGAAHRLDTPPNVLLGIDVVRRDEHLRALAPGATLVLFTDGLIERRGSSIDAGLDWLTAHLQGAHARTADAICDDLLAELGDDVEDDVALLVLRVR